MKTIRAFLVQLRQSFSHSVRVSFVTLSWDLKFSCRSRWISAKSVFHIIVTFSCEKSSAIKLWPARPILVAASGSARSASIFAAAAAVSQLATLHPVFPYFTNTSMPGSSYVITGKDADIASIIVLFSPSVCVEGSKKQKAVVSFSGRFTLCIGPERRTRSSTPNLLARLRIAFRTLLDPGPTTSRTTSGR